VRDTENERLTLILADSDLRSLMTAPWDAGLFCAGLAARAIAPAEALVLTPAAGVPVPPLSFMRSLGAAVAEVKWLRTITLAEVISSHPPGSRPVLLDRPLGPAASYIGLTLLDSIAEAHASVDALVQAAGPSASAVADALLLVYTAESRWWSLPQTSPQTAGVGLDYALRAQAVAEGELEKMRVAGVMGTTITGSSGDILLRLENGADYPVSAQVSLSGTGITFPDGAVLTLELTPGATELPVTVNEGPSPHDLRVTLAAGAQVVDEWSGSVEFVTVRGFLPWMLAVLLLAALTAGAVFLVRRGRHRRRRPAERPGGGSAG
jgi:hypothetical protein